MRTLAALLLLVAAGCGESADPAGSPDAARPDGALPVDGAPDTGCPAGKPGAGCILALHDTAAATCTAADLAALAAELDERADLGPLWADGRALFRTDAPVAIAGTFNEWSETALASAALCDSSLVLAVAPVASGAHEYKLVSGGTYTLDPHNPAFAYDDFGGNADGANSALVTPDAGVGQLVRLPQACSDALDNCRPVLAYLPPGYDAPAAAATTYPVLFMHDGQNVFDDHDCCFGHTGWELNVALDAEIAAGRVKPIIVIAAGNTPDRSNEYALDPAKAAALMRFQVMELQPAALAHVRWDQQRLGIGGSSLGGLLSIRLALAYPETYREVASLSGAFWPGQDSGTALRDELATASREPLAIYLDHGGDIGANTDGAADNVEVRDLLVGLGWPRGTSPACTPGETLCYFHEPGASHDELAWKARTWRFLQFLYPAAP